MATQAQKGKAFEYACLKALNEILGEKQEIWIDSTEAYETAKTFYSGLGAEDVEKMDKGAKAAVRVIRRLEPLLDNPDDDTPLYLTIQEDAKGIAGDVRDVVCIRNKSGWEIGISCKHNHTAVKHSRLSQTIDFGKQWFNKACSEEYFKEISPIFLRLISYKSALMLWRDIEKKEKTTYMPLLDAFINELRRLDKKYPGEIPGELVRYLLGRNDFYKVISNDSKKLTTIQAYNLFGTLNRPSKEIKPIQKVHQLLLPTRFFDISYKRDSSNTVVVTCDGGWAFSFRIHNASSSVEASLKFDIQIAGMPPELHTQIEPW